MPPNPVITADVVNEALFTFGIQGQSGETFSFTPIDLPPPVDIPLSLTLKFEAEGSLGTTFDVFFDAWYVDDTGQHAPVSSALVSQPVDPCQLLYTLQELEDPPFSVSIFMINPASGNTAPVTFSEVPEPTSCVLLAAASLGMAVLGRRQRGVRRRGPGRDD